jgi:hypothetical protein
MREEAFAELRRVVEVIERLRAPDESLAPFLAATVRTSANRKTRARITERRRHRSRCGSEDDLTARMI